MFISELFTGSISDKVITEQSGFYELLSLLKVQGYVKEGDAVMADKGFTIEKGNLVCLSKELRSCSLRYRSLKNV